jgi:hypothetical protein
MNNKTIFAMAALAMLAAFPALAAFEIKFTGEGYTGSGLITQATDNGGGLYAATGGSFTMFGFTFDLAPIPSGYADVTIHNIANSGGADLFGDNIFGINNFVSADGLVFTSPGVSGNINGFNGDVINFWGNGGGSFTLAYAGPDFAPGLHTLNGQVTVTAVPESTATTKYAGLSALGVTLFALRRKFLPVT